MEITWSPAKDKKNRRKHNVSFKTAESVFADPDYVLIFDRKENGEERWCAVGYAGAIFLLTVVHIVVNEFPPIASFLHEGQLVMNEQFMKIAASGMSEADRDIDLSDVPELRGRKGVRVRDYPNLSVALEAARSSQTLSPAPLDVKAIR